MVEREWQLRKDLCEVASRLYQAGFMAGSDGNISTIVSDTEILITPSRLCKGFMKPEQMIKIDRQGNKIAGDLPPTSESAMHLAAYEERPDICSVIHCHPPLLVAFTVAGLDLPSKILPEIEVIFGGKIPVAPYATPGGKEVADSLRPFIREKVNSVVILDHHGVIGVGQDVYQASMKVEHAEASARVIYYARQLGGEKPLPTESMGKLQEVHKRIKELESKVFAGYCHAPECPTNTTGEKKTITDNEIERVVRQVVEGMKAERN